NKDKINSLRNHIDLTGEISEEELKTASIEFTTSEHSLQRCDYIIIVVPTPITSAKKPNLQYLNNASKIIGRNITSHTVIIYESTVYPGTTEDVCIPILEEHSNLIAGEDFYVGYSPERINPGDKEHTFKRNSKVVSGQDKKTLEKIYKLYNTVIEAEVYKAPS